MSTNRNIFNTRNNKANNSEPNLVSEEIADKYEHLVDYVSFYYQLLLSNNFILDKKKIKLYYKNVYQSAKVNDQLKKCNRDLHKYPVKKAMTNLDKVFNKLDKIITSSEVDIKRLTSFRFSNEVQAIKSGVGLCSELKNIINGLRLYLLDCSQERVKDFDKYLERMSLREYLTKNVKVLDNMKFPRVTEPKVTRDYEMQSNDKEYDNPKFFGNKRPREHSIPILPDNKSGKYNDDEQ